MKTKIYQTLLSVSLLILFVLKLSQIALSKTWIDFSLDEKHVPEHVRPAKRNPGKQQETQPQIKTASVPETLYVNALLSTGNNDGTSWDNAYKGTEGLSNALRYAKQNTGVAYILVAKGKYKPTYSPEDGRNFADSATLVSSSKSHTQRAFLLVKDVKIYGGFDPANGITALTDKRILPGFTGEGSILSGDFKNNDGAITSGSQYTYTNYDDNAGQIVIAANDVGTAVLDGFAVTAGYARENVSITVNTKTVSKKQGGGMFNVSAAPVVSNVIFYANKGTNGGAMYNISCPEIKIYNSIFSGNLSTESGGAIYNSTSPTAFANVIFSGNTATQYGGGIYNFSSSISQIINSVFSGNKSTAVGGAIMNVGGTSSSVLGNSIIWGNSSTITGGSSLDAAKISYSIVEGFSDGTGNANTDPLFEDAPSYTAAPFAGGNYHVKSTSLATIDKGSNTLIPTDISTDLAGNTRIQADKVDMGAYESEPQEIPLERLYVNAGLITGKNNGADWENAFSGPYAFARAMQYAQSHSSVKDVWVTKGTYYTAYRADTHSDTNPLDPNNAFVLTDGVKIYGGFTGSETDITLRDWKTNVTILSGDQNKNNMADDDDAYQVMMNVNLGPETVLDGFTITGGYAAGSTETTLEIDGTTVARYAGAGMYNHHASPTIRNCTFHKNVSRNSGGGMANMADSRPVLTNVKFIENTAVNGGAMYNNGMEHQFSDLLFENNTATSHGGAVCNDRAFVTFMHTVFSENTAARGGAIATTLDVGDNTATGKYLGCLFVKNTASGFGGAYYYENGTGDSPVFINSTFSKDICSAENGGNIIYFQQHTENVTPKFYNCIIEKAATGTFYGGSSPGLFQAQYNLTNYLFPVNEVVKDNITATDFGFQHADSPAGEDEQYGTIDDGFRPLMTSPAVNAGFNDFTPAALEKDLTGKDRILNGSVDIGAYEYSLILSTLYVREELTTGNNNGTSWNDAYQGKGGLSEALYYARQNQGVKNIWVAKGTYTPTRRGDNFDKSNPDDKNNTFVLVEGVKVYGGFAGTETSLDERDWGNNQTILSGEIGADNNYTDNLYHVVVSVGNTAATELNGFVITLGMADANSSLTVEGRAIPTSDGGGMYHSNSSPVLRNLVFTYNYANKNGAGIVNDNSFPNLANVVFFRNLANKFGGAVYNIKGSHPTITHATFHRNYAGAIVNESHSGITMANSIMWGNTSWETSTPVDIFDREALGTTVKNSITEVFGTEGTDGILKQDPQFVSLNPPSNPNGKWMTAKDGLGLKPGSPAVNTGDDLLTPADINQDVTGLNRVWGGRTDMGAYEMRTTCIESPTLFVDSSLVESGDGTSWSTAFKTLAEALEVLNLCPVVKEIMVAKGTYFPTTLNKPELPFVVNRAVKIFGGYPSGGGIRDHRANLTILDGNIGDPALSTDNSSHIMAIAGISVADSVVIDGLQFQNGRTMDLGGSVTINNVSVPYLQGAGIYIGKNSSTTPISIRNCTFTNNYSLANGGAIYSSESQVILHSCRFFNNNAADQAPGIYVSKGAMQIVNSLFTGNTSAGPGGAITLNEASASSLVNSTLYKNHSTGTDAYGGALNCNNSNLTISNSIFNGNTYGGTATASTREKSDINHNGNSTLSIHKSLMQSGSPYLSCTYCPAPNTDPQFIDVTAPTKKGLGLLAGSKAINKGDKQELPSYVVNDLLGAERVRGEETDLGAFEAIPLTDPLTRLYVKADIETGYNNGYGWENAFYGSNGFARALEYARNNSSVKEIWVAKGTYYTFGRADNHDASNPLDPSNSFVLVEGLKIYGGFNGHEEDVAERDWKTNTTILSGDQNKNGIADNGDAYQVLISLNNGPETLLDGFTITGGYAASFTSTNIQINGTTIYQSSGAGMHNFNSSPTIRNCIFYRNTARGTGGGMANWDQSKPDLVNVTFRQNKALTGGGMFYFLIDFYGTPVVHKMSNLVFDGNVAEGATGGEGGAVCNSRSFISFENTVFINNSAAQGGAVAALNYTNNYYQHFETYSNCLFVNNTATEAGGAYYFATGYPHGPVFINSSFSKNICNQASGGDVFNFQYISMTTDYPAFYNCILEKADNAHDFFGGSYNTLFVAERNLTNYPLLPYWAEKNIVTDHLGLTNSSTPAGADGVYGTSDDGLIPLPASPAINGGNNDYIPIDLVNDFNSNKRIQGPFTDIGAYEYNQSCEETIAAISTNGDMIQDLALSDQPVYLFNEDKCSVMGIFQAVNEELQSGQLNAYTTIETVTGFYNEQPFVRRHYDLEPKADLDGHKGIATLYFTNDDFKNYNGWAENHKPLPISGTDVNSSNLLIWQWHGSSETRAPGTYTKNGIPSAGKYIKPNAGDIVWNEALRRWEIKFQFSGFSGFFVTTLENGSLPVTLSSFTVSEKNTELGHAAALLNWTTTSESNSDSFVIERSITGKSWEQIGQVKAEGSSDFVKKYTFTDEKPLPGNNLYRLKMIDQDGTFAFSSIRNLRIQFLPGTILYPNPVADLLYIDVASDSAIEKIVLRNAAGQPVGTYPYAPGEGIPVTDLAPGIYFVEMVGTEKVLQQHKIVVAR
ncbi:hypothetical protein DYBT9275_02424 [Dyadobacter sp. CECT 9275]|uniref:Right handed beta helix domain-containing protein n=1 Tax=Dyadobacter helix TaxID=2822344 RepID=A0A916JBS6_9BACT|nr:choice-of-anchor Q domain-containing protein [Dyadobacter sp. CECT 9275]CAG5000249.1 hypothetical protein DYBT9275_02424 [Dyadobacter sp. CECT 9275]